MILGSLPLLAFTGVASALLSFFIALRLYMAYRAHPQKGIQFFFLFYLFFGLFYFIAASAQFIPARLGSEVIVGALQVLSYFFLNISFGYLLAFPYQVTGHAQTARTIVMVTFAYNVLFTGARIFYFSPSAFHQLVDYTYWQPVFPGILRILTGVLAVGAAANTTIFFLRHGIEHKNDIIVRHRSFWLASGVALLVVAAIIAFIVSPQGVALYVLGATFLVLWGLVLIMRGILYTSLQRIDI